MSLKQVCIAALLCNAWLNVPCVLGADIRPNFILFIADDMACEDCGPYGHKSIRTPNLDRLAAEGMRFDRAFLTCSSCSPSRSSIITGRYPHNTGAHQLHLPLPAEQITFAERLKGAGYWTAAAGKWHLGPAVKDRFDVVREGGTKFVETLHDRPQDKPFFLWLAFSDPHRPYQPGTLSPPHQPSDAIVPPYLPDVPETRGDLAQYYDEIGRLDGVVGEVLDELDRQGITENTMVLFISDNGRPFPRCKTTVYDSGIRTPWIVRYPKQVKAGSVCQSLVSSLDIAPTILAMASVERPASFQGTSFQPLLADPSAKTRDRIFAEHNWHDFDDHGRAVRDERYKYIRNYYTDIPGTPPADAVRSPTFAVMQTLLAEGQLAEAQRSCFVVPRAEEELYDLATDPHELRNLASDHAHAEVLSHLRKDLAAWQQETGDRTPSSRRPDEFDRTTGERLERPRKKN